MPLPSHPIAPTSGMVDGFAAFQQLVVNDSALFARLQNAPTTDAFVDLAVEVGAARGFAFGADDVRASLQAARCTWIERNFA
ncbi:MAG TPA: Nif11-like leader peptide family natural product precursor [Opitutaceae bacterium]|jgi:hypothetical protein|nr:Nif11-like leader peptide family natural product precursor [Opitutaceae bacterium]